MRARIKIEVIIEETTIFSKLIPLDIIEFDNFRIKKQEALKVE